MVAERSPSVQPSRPAAAVAVSGLGAFLCSLDSALNVAFPAISADFGVSPRQIALVIVFYHVPIGVLTVIGGLLGDRFGHRRVFAAGVWTSALAFPLCGLAPDYAFLLGARALQGAGAGMVFGTAPALVALALAPDRRGFGLGALNAAAGVGLASAPLIAGLLLEVFGWRSVFLFRVPLALAVAAGILTFRGLARAPRPGRRSARDGDDTSVLGLPRRMPAALLLGAALVVVANAASFGIYVLVPYYLIDVARHPAAVAGAIFMTVPLSTALGGLAGGWLTRRFDPRHLVVAGLILETVGLLAVATLRDGTAVPVMVVAFALTGAGLGMFQVPNMAVAMAALPDRHQGLAGGTVAGMRTVGVLAAALLSPWLHAVRQAAHRSAIAEPAPLFLAAFSDTFLAGAALSAVGLALALVLRERTRRASN